MALLPWFRALHIAATVLIGGSLAFEALVLRRCGPLARAPEVSAALERWLERLLAWSIVVGLVSWAGWLAATASGMSGLAMSQALAPQVIGTVIRSTTFGHAWTLRLVLMVVLAALVFSGLRRSKAGALLFAIAAVMLVGSVAWTGHALGTSPVHVWIDAAHMLGASVWVGMLPLLALVLRKAVADPRTWGELGVASADRFSLPGFAAVLVLALSGVANTYWMLDSVSDLARTHYGRVLSLKLALVILMLLLAAANRFVFVGRVRHASPQRPLRSLRQSVLAELALGAGILAVVAWLGVTPPVAHEHMMHDMGAATAHAQPR